MRNGAELAGPRGDPDDGCGHHGADADRIDVIEVRALELDPGRTEPKRLVDHEVGNKRAHPGNRNDRIQPESVFEHLEDAEFHQEQRDRYVEDHPHHPPGVAVREARKEIRPGDRARVGIRHVDLQLRNDDESPGKRER
ncbi:MAG: hypothetical protein WA177_09635, partial [Xanthobacteraceae bacterium]